MASLKDMRSRIGSVKATQKITKAMQMVAAAKLRRAQDNAQNARPYAERMASVIANLAAGVTGDGAPKLLIGTGATQRQLARGERLTELLKQPQYSPLAVEEQVVSVYAGTRGYLDRVPTADVRRFEAEMLAHLHTKHQAILDKIRTEKDLKNVEDDLKSVLSAFAETFA